MKVVTTRGLEEPSNQNTKVYTLIRSEILAGKYAPGCKLKIQEFADQMDVSPGAVREALSRLVPEGLVVTREKRGFEVSPLSIADLTDLTNLRCYIEAQALRLSVAKGDAAWEANIVAAAHRLKTVKQIISESEPRPSQEWITAHAEFHLALVGACESPRLLSLHTQLYEQSERYRNRTAYVQSQRPVVDEHQELVDLALARRVESLVESMNFHIRRTTNLIIESERSPTGLARQDA